ncbi:MAG: TerC family protein [Candidatus Sumerlaeaceae bacterium]|nr:TerC family protein [Candidatus Sumerlaeaceae bacterium]
MHATLWAWIGFNLFVVVMLAIDLGVFNRKAHVIGFREALGWSIVWIAMALAFNLGLLIFHGPQVATEYLAGYLIEKALSVDNVFVFLLVFTYFGVDRRYQHRVLFLGILTALVLRGVMILAGTALIARFHWVLYVFGVFLIVTGVKMAIASESHLDPGDTLVVRLARRFLPITDGCREAHFVVRENGRWMFTPLFVVLLVVETTDVVFALDSIPAIFAVTRDPFIVYTSNVFAILGLRALYFLLAGAFEVFRYLKYGLAFVLAFVGVKMLLDGSRWEMSVGFALGVVAIALLLSILVSLIVARHERAAAAKERTG